MNKIRIGIDGELFNTWGGGIDFIAIIAEALEATGEVETILLAPESSWCDNKLKTIKNLFKAHGSIAKAKILRNKLQVSNKNMIYSFAVCTPNTKVVTYNCMKNRFWDNLEKKKEACCVKNDIDILLPSANCKIKNFKIPRIGYIYDFQHKYLPDFFTEEECLNRDKDFKKQIENSKYLIVNAKSVKQDIEKFFPNHNCEIIVLPFKPFQKPVVSRKVDLSKYNLPAKYYVICNQFWMHKDHITAFEALELVYNKGFSDIHLVCTGLINDTRNPKYGDEIRKRVNSLKCKNNIHLLGFLPKDDQIEIMKGAIGLIQPTLFEGGPGGGSAYNAICLGLPILLSDIPVNKEIVGVDSIDYFEKKNSSELANLMIKHMNDIRQPDEETDFMIERNKREYGEELLKKLKEAIQKEK